MIPLSATEVRKEWSSVIDGVIRERPALIKRTRDKLLLSDTETILAILESYKFTAQRYTEADGSITLSLNEIDLIENGKDMEEARHLLAESILDYAGDYYDNYALWSKAPNRKSHIPYVLKAMLIDDVSVLEEEITCRVGKS